MKNSRFWETAAGDWFDLHCTACPWSPDLTKTLPVPPPPLGLIEPHAPLLRAPPDGHLLYKIMTVENLLRSIEGGYLHFNRVDSYTDLLNGDLRDGEQLPTDRAGNQAARFAKAPDFSTADYYDLSRARTYACCLSLENSDYIWTNYGNGSARVKSASSSTSQSCARRSTASWSPAPRSSITAFGATRFFL